MCHSVGLPKHDVMSCGTPGAKLSTGDQSNVPFELFLPHSSTAMYQKVPRCAGLPDVTSACISYPSNPVRLTTICGGRPRTSRTRIVGPYAVVKPIDAWGCCGVKSSTTGRIRAPRISRKIWRTLLWPGRRGLGNPPPPPMGPEGNVLRCTTSGYESYPAR